MAAHRERLVAPPSWWIAAVAFAVVCGWIVLVATRWPIGIAAAAVVGVLSAATLWRYGDVVVAAGADGVRAGRAHLALEHVGAVEALGVKAFRERLGPTADARAWLVTRPYVQTGVVVMVDDPADPTPYWLVSCRAPERLVAAVESVRQTGPTPATEAPHMASKKKADAKKAGAKKTSAKKKGSAGSRGAWKVMDRGSTVAAALLSREVAAVSWRAVTGRKPPINARHPEVDAREAVAWAVVGGALTELVKIGVRRYAATYWVKSTGQLPPGMKAISAPPLVDPKTVVPDPEPPTKGRRGRRKR